MHREGHCGQLMCEAAVLLGTDDTSPVGIGDKKKRGGPHETLGFIDPRHVAAKEDRVLSSRKVKGVEGRDHGLSEFFEFLYGVQAMMHLERDEGLLAMGAVAKELDAKGEPILAEVPNEEEGADQGRVYHFGRQSLHVGNVGLDELDGVLSNRGKVYIVARWFVLRKDNGPT